jgi:pectin methylesterase-like acyl-CoA thioesterase
MEILKRIVVGSLLFFTGFIEAQQTDVWDFGGVALDPSTHTNHLNEEVINSWYDAAIIPGTSGVNFPTTFTSGVLSWVGNSSDRLRTTNTQISRFDNNIASVSGFTGRVYCNGSVVVNNGLPNNRYMRMLLGEDDEVSIIARGDTNGNLIFVKESNPSEQQNTFPIPSASGAVVEAKFVAQTPGYYRVYEPTAKTSFYRILRKDAVYTTVQGSIDVSQASGIPTDYQLVFTNVAGKSWVATVNSNVYQVNLPVGYTYEVSLLNANGYVISAGGNVSTVGVVTPELNHPVAISGVSLVTLTGSIIGLNENSSNLSLVFTPDPQSGSVFVPTPTFDVVQSTYTVLLESGLEYTLSAFGVNDYELATTQVSISENDLLDLQFTLKPLYAITLDINGLTPLQIQELHLSFSNINEPGYVYSFSNMSNVSLRNGTYSISASGLSQYPVQLALTSNLTVSNQETNKTLQFSPVKRWTFDDEVINTTTQAYYRGLQLNGQITTVVNSGHVTAKTGASILVPISGGEKVIVSYYYTANFSIDGGAAITTNTLSTSIIEQAHFVYPGTETGFVTLAFGGPSSLTSYITEIRVVPHVVYTPEITVGVDKQYQTIQAALEAISTMIRNNQERVTVLIDPGNYEEMLVINQPNITFKNASATPSIILQNGGVSIDDQAVRITSYYGHGYHYFSMGADQKWNQEVLAVNLANGNFSHLNAGAGTTNGSFWNATVVVRASGFEAEHIIFENSFNQYISQKESQDVVVAWTTGSPGVRPTNSGNTAVQHRSFVERAAAIAVVNNTDKVILNRCRVVGRQDSFFGGAGSRVVVYKGVVMGAVDFIFGGMNAVFYQTELAMNTSDVSNDIAYITAAQQSSGRGYLMYECTVTTAEPGLETASVYRSKPGYFGRPWLANTSEVVFYNTTIETSNYPGFVNESLIRPLGWLNTLGGTSPGMYEYGTTELSQVNHGPSRASWATFLTEPILNDGTPITTFQFTKGNDDWDPLPFLIQNDLSLEVQPLHSVSIQAVKDSLHLSNIFETCLFEVFDLKGKRYFKKQITEDTSISLPFGIWIIRLTNVQGVLVKKVYLTSH